MAHNSNNKNANINKDDICISACILTGFASPLQSYGCENGFEG